MSLMSRKLVPIGEINFFAQRDVLGIKCFYDQKVKMSLIAVNVPLSEIKVFPQHSVHDL